MDRNRRRRTWTVWEGGGTHVQYSATLPLLAFRESLGASLCAELRELGFGSLLTWMLRVSPELADPALLGRPEKPALDLLSQWVIYWDAAGMAPLDHAEAVLAGILFAQTDGVRSRIRQAAGL